MSASQTDDILIQKNDGEGVCCRKRYLKAGLAVVAVSLLFFFYMTSGIFAPASVTILNESNKTAGTSPTQTGRTLKQTEQHNSAINHTIYHLPNERTNASSTKTTIQNIKLPLIDEHNNSDFINDVLLGRKQTPVPQLKNLTVDIKPPLESTSVPSNKMAPDASSNHIPQPSSNHTPTPSNFTGQPVKVILYTYMRSGSTLTGELFAQDSKNTFYLFEPVDGMYSYMYGMYTGMFPLDLFFYTDGTKRELPDFEKEFITTTTLQILNCNFTGLPADVMFQRFLLERKYPATLPYIQCLRKRDVHAKPEDQVHDAQTCLGKIVKLCPQYFDRSNKRYDNCYRHFHEYPYEIFSNEPAMKMRDECIQKANARVQTCLDFITEECQKRRVRSIKTIRLKLEIMDAMLSKDPDVKVIFLVRDPRGILSSRRKSQQVSKLAHKNIMSEAPTLCEHMLADETAYEALRETYPNRIKRVRYEDLAMNPEQVAEDIYQFTQNTSIPKSVQRFLLKSTNAVVDGGDFGTKRANATATAFKWQRRLSRKTIDAISVSCRQIIKKLGYT